MILELLMRLKSSRNLSYLKGWLSTYTGSDMIAVVIRAVF